MAVPLLANRYARDRAGRLFDLATGRDVVVRVGDDATDSVPSGAVEIDRGQLDDASSFAAFVTGVAERSAACAGAETWARLAAESLDGNDGSLSELVVTTGDEKDSGSAIGAIAREARASGCVPVSLAGLRRLPSPALLAHRSTVAVDPERDREALCTLVLALSALRARVVLIARSDPSSPRSRRDGDEEGDLNDGALSGPRLAWSAAHVADRGPAWPALTPARIDRRLQSVRGVHRRRREVDAFLRLSVELVEARLGRGHLEGAARVAREARSWTGWWLSSPERRTTAWLDGLARLQELEQRARIEQGRTPEARPDLESVIWFARASGSPDLSAHARASLARAWRLGGAVERARGTLGDDWPSAASVQAQLRWGREALWATLLAGDCRQAGRIASSLRSCARADDVHAQALVSEELAVFYHVLGDTRACDLVLRDAASGAVHFTWLERMRSTALRAVIHRPSGRQGSAGGTRIRAHARGLTPAMRAEQEQLRNASRGHRALAGDQVISPGELMIEGLLELLQACHADDDESRALGRACGLLRERLGATAVGVWTHASNQPLAAAGSGRVWPSLCAERSRVSGLPLGPEASDACVQAARPIKHASAILGAVACVWLPGRPLNAVQVEVLLTAAAAACVPLVRAWLDRAAAPVQADAFGLVGESRAIRELRAGILRAANVPYHVLVEGESGSGKELVARAIHQASTRRQKRFCAVNCAALTDDLLEAELFGHARGAFTGALAERAGLFEDACGGTLLLDEIADLSPRGQAKVLRVLQDGEVRRVGENFSRRVDVRIVAATNKPLRDEAERGRFREDLRYRLDVLRLSIPPLRDRREDIALLASHFWREASARVGSRAVLDGQVVATLSRHAWPGNVRELQNVIATLAVHAPVRGRVPVDALPDTVRTLVAAPPSDVSLDEARRRFEMDYVRATLSRHGGRRTEAARALGLTRQGLAKLMSRLGLECP